MKNTLEWIIILLELTAGLALTILPLAGVDASTTLSWVLLLIACSIALHAIKILITPYRTNL